MLSARPSPRLSTAKRARASSSAASQVAPARLAKNEPPSGTSAADLLTVIGRDGRFKRLAPRFAQTFGYAEADLLEQLFISFVHPDDRAATRAAFDKVSSRRPTLGVENRFRCKDGSYHRLAWTALNTPEGFLYAVARPMPELQQPDEEPSQPSPCTHPGQAVPRDGSVAAVCHDLRQPLTVILVQTQLLQRQMARGEMVSADRLETHLAYVFAAARRMRDMTQDLLDSSLQQSGRAPGLLLTQTDLVALARQAVSEHELLSQLHHFGFQSEVPTLEAVVDRTRVHRVLSNLLTNAVKYSPRGGVVDVCVSSSEGPLGASALFTVRDEGVGIPADELPYIFDRFHRGKNVVGHFSGTGVGLASARELVELHGGTISVESQEGQGSTFSVRLPLVPLTAEAAAPNR